MKSIKRLQMDQPFAAVSKQQGVEILTHIRLSTIAQMSRKMTKIGQRWSKGIIYIYIYIYIYIWIYIYIYIYIWILFLDLQHPPKSSVPPVGHLRMAANGRDVQRRQVTATLVPTPLEWKQRRYRYQMPAMGMEAM